MALVDVSDFIVDPDFVDSFTLINRASSINQYGEMQLTETSHNVSGVIQNINNEMLNRFPDAAEFTDGISVWYRGVLQAQAQNGYCDVVVWNDYRYLVKIVTEQFMNFGSGWTSALCSKEVPGA
jgi:hypothetical protein